MQWDERAGEWGAQVLTRKSVCACVCEQKEWIEYLAYPCNESICVCNLSTSDLDRAWREKRFNHEVDAD